MYIEGRYVEDYDFTHLNNGTLSVKAYSLELEPQVDRAIEIWNKHLGTQRLKRAVGDDIGDIKVGFTGRAPGEEPWYLVPQGTLAITAVPSPVWNGIVYANPLVADEVVGFPLTVAHEIGHALGYLHYDQPGHLMHPQAEFMGTRILKGEDKLARLTQVGGNHTHSLEEIARITGLPQEKILL